ncbi:MAG: menaquinone biosynthesis protein [Taibaiella sp.]|nr:menaquinone biosynthesis protein [Taibaiella sp.]
MNQKIRVGAVSYLNAKPLLFGIERSDVMNDMELTLDYPSILAAQLKEDTIDMALLPVAAIEGIEGARVVSDYGIAAEGNVVSVALFSRVPLPEISSVYLDYQSRTSVKLAEILLEHHWRQPVSYLQADEHYIDKIYGSVAGVIIGDRALENIKNFEYVYDLSAAWKAFTGLDFVFAAWVANKELPSSFIKKFNKANREGLLHLDMVIAANPFPVYDLYTYYTDNIKYLIDEKKKAGMETFLRYVSQK